jgi:hypothetical protein
MAPLQLHCMFSCSASLMFCVWVSWPGPVARWCDSCVGTRSRYSILTVPTILLESSQRPEPPKPSCSCCAPLSLSTHSLPSLFSMSYFGSSKLWVINISAFLETRFPTLCPFVLILNDNSASRLYFSVVGKGNFLWISHKFSFFMFSDIPVCSFNTYLSGPDTIRSPNGATN